MPASVCVGLIPAHRLPLSELADLTDRVVHVTVPSVSIAAINTSTNQSLPLALLAYEIREVRSAINKRQHRETITVADVAGFGDHGTSFGNSASVVRSG